MIISDIRRLNFWSLIHPDGYTAEGISRCSTVTGLTEERIRHLVKTDPMAKAIKNIGSRAARDIEEHYNKPDGWLDHYRSQQTQSELDSENEDEPGTTIEEIRLHNVNTLIEQDYEGNKAKFAAAIDRTATSISRWYSNKQEKRSIGTTLARDIERKCNLKPGYLDVKRFKIFSDHKVISEEEELLLKRYDALTCDEKRLLEKFLSFLEQSDIAD